MQIHKLNGKHIQEANWSGSALFEKAVHIQGLTGDMGDQIAFYLEFELFVVLSFHYLAISLTKPFY